jgi:hypothetical protein
MKQITCVALCAFALAGIVAGLAATPSEHSEADQTVAQNARIDILKTAPAPGYGAPDYIFDIVKRNPTILRAWESIVPSSYTNESWIKEFQGVTFPVHHITIDQKPFYLGDVCKPHLCADNNIVYLIAVDGSEVYGLLNSKFLNAAGIFFGSPNLERQQVMVQEMAEEGSAVIPQPKESTDR